MQRFFSHTSCHQSVKRPGAWDLQSNLEQQPASPNYTPKISMEVEGPQQQQCAANPTSNKSHRPDSPKLHKHSELSMKPSDHHNLRCRVQQKKPTANTAGNSQNVSRKHQGVCTFHRRRNTAGKCLSGVIVKSLVALEYTLHNPYIKSCPWLT